MKNLISILSILSIIGLGIFFGIQDAKASDTEIISCDNGSCTTTVHQHSDSWMMLISCDDGSSWAGGGSGQWGGSACN